MVRLLKVSRQPDGSPEVFHSVQGEGVCIGRPAVFLRLSLCNLACIWCDTKYTWDWEHYDPNEEILEMSQEALEQHIQRHKCKYLVVTGGEPLIQQKQLVPLLEHLKNKGFRIEIESNGTIVPDPELVNLIDHWSVSPKLGNSGNPLSSREIPEVYGFFARLPSTYFKYVVQNKEDVAEVQSIVQKYNLAPETIILMPEAENRDVLLERSRWLVEFCKGQGYLFSTRLQILLWDNKRGV